MTTTRCNYYKSQHMASKSSLVFIPSERNTVLPHKDRAFGVITYQQRSSEHLDRYEMEPDKEFQMDIKKHIVHPVCQKETFDPVNILH